MEKITYDEYHKRLDEYRAGLASGRRMPRPNLRDVDLETVPAEKRILVSGLMEREQK